MTILSLVVELSPLELKIFYWINVVQRNNPTVLHVLNSKVTHNVTGSILFCMCNFHYYTVIGCWFISPWTCKFYKIIVIRNITRTFLQVLLWNLHIMFVCIWSCAYGIFMSVCPSVCLWTQFYLELFSYSFAHTALKFIHNVFVHMKLVMCNFHDHTIIGCEIIFPWTCKFYWLIVVQRNNPIALHVLNSKLHTMLLVVYSSACVIFITILSLVAELSPLELINFTKSLLSRALLLHFCKYSSEIYT